MKKPTNYLASHAEKAANYRFPHQKQFQKLIELTNIIKQAWQAILPETLLETLMVIGNENNTLTLSTNNHTLANHLNYSHQPLLSELQQVEPSLSYIQHLRFRVIDTNTAITTDNSNSNRNLQGNQNVNIVTSCNISESTKQNIAQLIELVTDDIELQRALQKLIKD